MKLTKSTTLFTLAALTCFLVFPTSAIAQEKDKLSDAEVAFAAVTANQIDISYADIAKERSKDTDILKFAETMQRDHNAVIAQAVALAKKLGVVPKDNSVSQALLADAEKTKSMLRSKTAATFNKAYIDNEVTYHKSVIAAVEELLIPETENTELKELLQNVVPALKAHLMHAEMLQKNYTK